MAEFAVSRAILGFFVMIVATVLATATRDVWTIDPDAAAYVELGQALASGHGYTLEGPGGALHTKYPPGLPLLLSLLARIAGPDAYQLFHLALVACFAAALLWIGGLVRRLGYSWTVALAVTACTGLSQTFFDLTVVYLRTEALFLPLTMGALWCLVGRRPTERGLMTRHTASPAESTHADNPEKEVSGLPLLCAELLIIAAVLTRMAGVALLVIPVWRMLRPRASVSSRLRSAAIIIGCLLPIFFWKHAAGNITSSPTAVAAGPNYASEFLAAEPRDLTKLVQVDVATLDGAALVRRVVGNVEVLARACATLLTNVDRAAHRLPVGMLLLALVVVGIVTLLRRGGAPRDATLYLLATLCLYLIWPFNQQERFYAPLLPLLLLSAGEGLRATWVAAGRANRNAAGRMTIRIAGAAALAVLLAQHSDHPTVLGRWSLAYTALLVGVAFGFLATVAWGRSGRWPRPSTSVWLLALALFLPSFAAKTLGSWPARVTAFEQHRAAEPAPGPLQRIDTHPLLEQVALFLRDHTPADAVVMTDVPKMMTIMSGRRCIPFVYRADPPEVIPGEATLVFYTRELTSADAVMQAAAPAFDTALDLRGEDGTVVATLYATRMP